MRGTGRPAFVSDVPPEEGPDGGREMTIANQMFSLIRKQRRPLRAEAPDAGVALGVDPLTAGHPAEVLVLGLLL